VASIDSLGVLLFAFLGFGASETVHINGNVENKHN
jgi:hypothetical protein